MVLGDFNGLSSANDKLGGAAFTLSRLKYMNYLINNSEMTEVPFKRLRYTWRKRMDGLDNVFEILDKGVANMPWLDLFPQAHVQHHNFMSFDHCFIS